MEKFTALEGVAMPLNMIMLRPPLFHTEREHLKTINWGGLGNCC